MDAFSLNTYTKTVRTIVEMSDKKEPKVGSTVWDIVRDFHDRYGLAAVVFLVLIFVGIMIYTKRPLSVPSPPSPTSPLLPSPVPTNPSPSGPLIDKGGKQPTHSIGSKIAWSDTPEYLDLRGRLAESFTYRCPADGQISGEIWGTDVYTDESSICTAATHAGVITAKEGGQVTIKIKPGIKKYVGSTRNNVTSKDYPKEAPGSFIFQ